MEAPGPKNVLARGTDNVDELATILFEPAATIETVDELATTTLAPAATIAIVFAAGRWILLLAVDSKWIFATCNTDIYYTPIACQNTLADVALAVLNDAVDVFEPVVERAYVVPDTCTVPCTLYSVVKGVVNVAIPSPNQ